MAYISEPEKRSRRCCFTGHRPEKISTSRRKIKKMLKKEIQQAYNEGFNVFITGVCRGVDIWAAEITLKLRRKHKDIKLICAIPYPDFYNRWTKQDQKLCTRILLAADLNKTISNSYSNDCYQKRNCWMVDHSARVIAVYNGEKSGTQNTVNYANATEVPIVIINCEP